MAYKIIYNQRFGKDIDNVIAYLDTEFGKKTVEAFYEKIKRVLNSLSHHPLIGAKSVKVNGMRAIFITAHNRLFYRVKGKNVIIMRLSDTRMRKYSK